jgi:hypothetical protein
MLQYNITSFKINQHIILTVGWVDSSGSGWGSLTGSYEHCNKPSDTWNVERFLSNGLAASQGLSSMQLSILIIWVLFIEHIKFNTQCACAIQSRVVKEKITSCKLFIVLLFSPVLSIPNDNIAHLHRFSCMTNNSPIFQNVNPLCFLPKLLFPAGKTYLVILTLYFWVKWDTQLHPFRW